MNRSPRASETPPRRAASVLNSCTVFGHCAFEARRETHRQQRMPRSGYPSWLALRRAFPESLPPTPATCSALRAPRSPPPVAGSAGQSPTWTVRRMDSDAGKENLLRGPKSRNRRSFDGLGCVRCPRASGPSARGCQRRSPMANATEHQRGRDARTGRIIPVAEALRRPSTTVVETYKVGKKGPRN